MRKEHPRLNMLLFCACAAYAALASLSPESADGAETPSLTPSNGQYACTSKEHWSFGPGVPAEFANDLIATVKHDLRPVQGFSEGLALRRIAKTDEGRYLGEYWVARSLFESKLVHVAYQGFASIAARPVKEETAGIQLAALDCLDQIHQLYPSLPLPNEVVSRIPDYFALPGVGPSSGDADAHAPISSTGLAVIYTAATSALIDKMSEDQPRPKDIDAYLALLRDSGPYESLARGLWNAKRGNHKAAVVNFDQFLSGSIPGPMARYVDPAHIFMARSLYSIGEFDGASAQLKLVRKSSNELAESLSELAWSYLQAERYSEAIGTAINLQAGGLRHTFAPEAPMVSAMALNEICQYPESVKSIRIFQKNYEEPYHWLQNWMSHPSPLYPLAVSFLKKTAKVPEKIGTEWIRSPLFISSQSEINLMFDEKDASGSLAHMGTQVQQKIGTDILKLVQDLKPRYYAAKAKQKPGEPLPNRVRNGLVLLKSELAHYRRMRAAAPFWRRVITSYQAKVTPMKSRLIARINADLDARSHRMYEQVDEVAENLQLVEVEIYNGASKDIIWQNAHPDYKDLAEKMKNDRLRASREKVWDWGHAQQADSNGSVEIWEDELGSFKANLYDNCSSKDKYLALKYNEHQLGAR